MSEVLTNDDSSESRDEPDSVNLYLRAHPQLGKDGDTREYDRVREIALRRVPKSYKQALDSVKISRIDNKTLKQCLKAANITGLQHARSDTKARALAMKMTQRQYCLRTVLINIDKETNESGRGSIAVRSLPQTSAKFVRNMNGTEEIEWNRGDVPVIAGDKVAINVPPLRANVQRISDTSVTSRQTDFKASEYCRLFHVLADARMTSARAQIMELPSEKELEAGELDPWRLQVARLYNDESFVPLKLESVPGEVTMSGIADIDPTVLIETRDSSILRTMFSEFKSSYAIEFANHRSSGQEDSALLTQFSSSNSHLIYAYWFLVKFPHLKPFFTGTVDGFGKQEANVERQAQLNRNGGSSRSLKRRRSARSIEVRMVGADAISSPLVQSHDVAREIEIAQRDKARAEAITANAKSISAVLSAIKDAKTAAESAEDEEESKQYSELTRKLLQDLNKSFPTKSEG